MEARAVMYIDLVKGVEWVGVVRERAKTVGDKIQEKNAEPASKGSLNMKAPTLRNFTYVNNTF